MSHSEQDELDLQDNDLFHEPENYYPPEKPPTFATYTTQGGSHLKIRMVGSSPLWGHLLWNAGQVVGKYLEKNAHDLVQGRNVLELGAGAGLPSLICSMYQPARVVVTDYPDAELIDNLQYNIDHAIDENFRQSIVAQGFLWGSDVTTLKNRLTCAKDGFDLVIMADILFNHSEHEKLLKTVQETLCKSADARALVFFTPYRPWLLEKDLNFFVLAKEAGFQVTKLFEEIMEKVMFPNDPGDETLRKTVFAYEIRWPS